MKYLRTRGIDTGLKYPYDVTRKKKMSLDNYLLDHQIVHLIRMTWSTQVDNQFYKNNTGETINSFFSHPYPTIASSELGYPNKKDYYLTEKDLLSSSDSDDEEVKKV